MEIKDENFLTERNIELCVYNARAFEWRVALPLMSHNFKSPRLNIQGSDARMLINMDSHHRYEVSLIGDPFKSFSFKFIVEREHKGCTSERNILLKSRGKCRLDKTTSSYSLIKFGEKELKLPERHKSYSIVFTLYVENDRTTRGNNCNKPSYWSKPIEPGSLADDFQKLLVSAEKADIDVKKEEKFLKVHSLVLNARSDILKSAFQVGFDKGFVQLEFTVDDTSLFELMLYIYTDVLPELTDEKAKLFYEIAEKYAMPGLKQKCRDFMSDDLTVENSCTYLDFALTKSDEDLQESATQYILDKRVFLYEDIWIPFCNKYPNIALSILNKSHKVVPNKRKRSL